MCWYQDIYLKHQVPAPQLNREGLLQCSCRSGVFLSFGRQVTGTQTSSSDWSKEFSYLWTVSAHVINHICFTFHWHMWWKSKSVQNLSFVSEINCIWGSAADSSSWYWRVSAKKITPKNVFVRKYYTGVKRMNSHADLWMCTFFPWLRIVLYIGVWMCF